MPQDDRPHSRRHEQLSFDIGEINHANTTRVVSALIHENAKLREQVSLLHRQNLELRDQIAQLIKIAARAIDESNQLHWMFNNDK